MKIKYIDRKRGKILEENPPAEGLLKFLYNNPLGRNTILHLAKRKFITEFYGKKMNQPNSIKKIQPFIEDLNINIDEAEKSIDEFTSFNDFFYRKLKRGARTIESGLVSPGDGKLLAFEKMSSVNQFYVKGSEFTLQRFLKNDALTKKFQNHAMLILRLAPNDYHRYHFPYNGIPSESTQIKGNYYSVSPIALVQNFTKVFTENKREYCILTTENQGEILLAPVGATMVGSIISTYQPNQKVKKSDEMGYFAFGGSTVVMLIDSSHFKIDEDILKNTQNQFETFVKMGEKIGEVKSTN